MATTTTNYGWDIPQSTDLVKDGATAIALLGQDIDTSMNTALAGKKAGMVLLNTTSFSAVASQSINDVFSSTYTNYRIVGKATFTAIASFRMRLRVSGADDTNAVYSAGYTYVDPAGGSGGNGGSNQTSFFLNADANTNETSFCMDIFYPNVVDETRLSYQTNWSGYGTGALYFNAGGATFKNTTAFTGFTLLPSTSTITGDVSVYGYNK
jgi:hypothetical protein